MHFPFAACLALGHARFALVEQVERMIDRVTDLAFGRAGDAVTGVECGIDGGFESSSGHRDSLEKAIGSGFFGIWDERVKAGSLMGEGDRAQRGAVRGLGLSAATPHP